MNSAEDETQNETEEERWSHWMVNAQRGDEASYRLLLNRLGPVIEGYVRHRFGPTGFEEDIVQESLLSIHKARHTYSPDRPYRPWMYAIVRHKAIDMLRRQKRHSPMETGNIDEQRQTGAEALIEGEQLFSGMTPKARQALILTKVVGLTIKEASTKLDISESAMKVRVHRALRELCNRLEKSQ